MLNVKEGDPAIFRSSDEEYEAVVLEVTLKEVVAKVKKPTGPTNMIFNLATGNHEYGRSYGYLTLS